MSDSSVPQLAASRESPATSHNGLAMLAIAAIAFALALMAVFARAPIALVPTGLLLLLILSGFYMIQPNQAAAILLFGAYRGTDRTEGLRWT